LDYFSLSRDYFCGFCIIPRGLGVGSVLVDHLSFFSLNNYASFLFGVLREGVNESLACAGVNI